MATGGDPDSTSSTHPSAPPPPATKVSSGAPRSISSIGPTSGPEPPFPFRIEGPVIKGFGRGSKELGIPTANIPIDGLSVGGREDVESGVYFGWAGLGLKGSGNEDLLEDAPDGNVFPMVMSIGWNPFYKNTLRSVEVHIMHSFPHDFYGVQMRLLVLGYIRPELDYVSRDALIADIKTDIEIARMSLQREAWAWRNLAKEWVAEL